MLIRQYDTIWNMAISVITKILTTQSSQVDLTCCELAKYGLPALFTHFIEALLGCSLLP